MITIALAPGHEAKITEATVKVNGREKVTTECTVISKAGDESLGEHVFVGKEACDSISAAMGETERPDYTINGCLVTIDDKKGTATMPKEVFEYLSRIHVKYGKQGD